MNIAELIASFKAQDGDVSGPAEAVADRIEVEFDALCDEWGCDEFEDMFGLMTRLCAHIAVELGAKP